MLVVKLYVVHVTHIPIVLLGPTTVEAGNPEWAQSIDLSLLA